MIEDRNLSFTPIKELGEFELIRRLTSPFVVYDKVHLIKGVGDDAAVFQLDDKNVLLTSSDLLVEGVHFDLSYSPPVHLGYKAAMVNFSDIIAMNALPQLLSVSFACSNYHSVELLEQIYAGIKIACDELKVDLIGGDTSASKRDLFLSLTVQGVSQNDNISFRSGAKHADLICITGDLGAAYAGLQILEREKKVFLDNPSIQPDLSDYVYVLERQLRPTARYDIIHFFIEHSIVPNAMIDISDGLANEIHHICKSSEKGAVIYSDKLLACSDYQTQLVSEQMNIPLLSFMLYGGEDYQLLFTIPPQYHSIISKSPDIHIIGYITEQFSEPMLCQPDGSYVNLDFLGHQHFR